MKMLPTAYCGVDIQRADLSAIGAPAVQVAGFMSFFPYIPSHLYVH
jgi:hypothetical protein